jgi:hypothetical protein
LLIYLPINVQRRMAEAVIVPLSILASAGVMLVAQRLERPLRVSWRRAAAFTLLATIPVTLFLFVGNLFSTARVQPPLFYPAAEIAAFNWLNQNSRPGEVVLSAFSTGNRLPAYTHVRVYVGHGPESLLAVPKTRETERFFGDRMTASERTALYEAMRIRYVFYGQAERAFASAANSPAWAADLERIYAEDGYAIYRIP